MEKKLIENLYWSFCRLEKKAADKEGGKSKRRNFYNFALFPQ